MRNKTIPLGSGGPMLASSCLPGRFSTTPTPVNAVTATTDVPVTIRSSDPCANAASTMAAASMTVP